MHTPHGTTTTLTLADTGATIDDYASAVGEALAHLLETGAAEATICVPDFLAAGHPWALRRDDDSSGWIAERGPSDGPDPAAAAMRVCLRAGDHETAATFMHAHDLRHPFVVDWDRRERDGLLQLAA